MKKGFLVMLVSLVFCAGSASYGYALETRAKILPRPLSGNVEVTLMGKEESPNTSAVTAYNVDVHQVAINGNLMPYNGINLVEYELSPASYDGVTKEWFTVDTTLLSGGQQNAFLIMQSGPAVNPVYSIKVALNVLAEKIIVQEFKDGKVIREWKFPYDLRLNRTYEIGIGNYGFSVNEITTVGLAGFTKTQVLFKNFFEIGFDSLQPAIHLNIYAGTQGAKARFYRERLWRIR